MNGPTKIRLKACILAAAFVFCALLHTARAGDDAGARIESGKQTALAARNVDLRDRLLNAIKRRFIVSLYSSSGRYQVERGTFEFTDPQRCFDSQTFCFGSNPSTRYGFAGLPGTSPEAALPFRLDENEAVVILGRTPPRVAYFGFNHYVFSRAAAGGGPGRREVVFGSIADSINMTRIGYHAPPWANHEPYGQVTAIVVSANGNVTGEMRQLLVDAGLDPEAINLQAIPTLSQENPIYLGYGNGADDFGVLLRAGLPTDPEQFDAYLASEPFAVWRVGIPDAEPSPYDWTPYIPRVTGTDENVVLPNAKSRLAGLVSALELRHATLTVTVYAADVRSLSGQECIRNYTLCSSDNQDALYDAGTLDPTVLTSDPSNFWYLVGVNHRRTGKGTYTNHTVVRADLFGGIAVATDQDAAGSAAYYAAEFSDGLNVGNLEDFYVFRVARTCQAEEKSLGYCVEAPYPTPGNPVGADEDDVLTAIGRIYVDQVSGVGPDKTEIVAPFMLVFN